MLIQWTTQKPRQWTEGEMGRMYEGLSQGQGRKFDTKKQCFTPQRLSHLRVAYIRREDVCRCSCIEPALGVMLMDW